MKTLRRYNIPNATYFLTVVTFERKPLLLKNADLFLVSWRTIKPQAWVVLPDHFHALIDVADRSLSDIIHGFKQAYRYPFERHFGKGRIWQHRFWDHMIRNEQDFRRHLDYIHLNPTHHNISRSPEKYPYSSYSIWVEQGYYDKGWSFNEFEGEFGE